MSPALAFIGISIIGTWGIASLALIAGGIIMIVAPGDQETASNSLFGGIVLVGLGLASGGLMQVIVGPLIGLDPPLRVSAKKIIPHEKMKAWASAGRLEDFPDGIAKEVRLRSVRVAVIRKGDRAYALSAICSHARLPMAGFPASPIKPEPIRDDCVMCPFHGARFEIDSGKVVRQPFSSEFNAEHPFLGRLQSKLLFFNKRAEDMQTYPVRIEDGEILVGLPR